MRLWTLSSRTPAILGILLLSRTMDVPSYFNSENSAPAYSASTTAGERVLERQLPWSISLASLPDQFIFQSQRIRLDLGARLWPVSIPCFGYSGTVEGVVSVTTLEHVKSLTIVV
jgi:hypothetical protein